MASKLLELIDRHRDVIMPCVATVSFAADEVIFNQDDSPAKAAFIITSGVVQVTRKVKKSDREIATLPAGSIVGEIALFSNSTRTATAKALTAVEAIAITRDELEKIKAADPAVAYEIATAMLEIVAERMHSTINRLESVYLWLT